MSFLKQERIAAKSFFKPFIIQSFTVSNDEQTIIFSSNISGGYHLWGLDVNHPFPYPLTSHNQNTESIHVNEDLILFASDHDGDENMQIYATTLLGGEPKPVLVKEGTKHFLHSTSGNKIYYSSNNENLLYLNAYEYNFETNEERLLNVGEIAETHLLAVSPNETAFAYITKHNHSHMHAFIKKDNKKIPIISNPEFEYRVAAVQFVNEQEAYVVTNYGKEFNYLATFSLETGALVPILEVANEDIVEIQNNNGYVYLRTIKGVRDNLYQFSVENSHLQRIEIPIDSIEQWVITESGTIFISGSTSKTPENIYRRDYSGEWKQLMVNRIPGISYESLVDSEIVTYLSFDGQLIEGLFFKAKPENQNGYTIVYPHGGPQFAEIKKRYDSLFQYFVNLGYNLFCPNFRGTPHYGTSFMRKIERDWGGGPRLDILSGIEWAIEEGKIEKGKVIVFGASYGGYMSLLLAGRHPDYFQACIDLFGPSNLFTLVNDTPEHWRARMDSWIGNPVRDREKLIEDSPLTYTDNWRVPLLVIQGANDPRVKRSESEQIVNALRAKNIEVEYMVFEDEGHGFSKKKNELLAIEKIEHFLKAFI
ncbi:S9 family peptidase [Fredinandcohnia sp. 179-A 10B2 NHS]|uniref:S9 family peptidase n=1 Tax=Fredinandcohnia sp. 179-A 10B2 NHS TaxID=3235176 RepID=UPI0039A067BB